MVRLTHLLPIILAVISLCSVSGKVVKYTVTFVPCAQGLTCPQKNPTTFNKTFALNGTLSPNIKLKIGDQLVFLLATTVTIHPLAICKSSPIPLFCQGATGKNLLNTPITQAGTQTSVTFKQKGIYRYGCHYHPGMGATIKVN